MGLSDDFRPSVPIPQTRLRVLPNFDVVVTGKALSPADELLLNSFMVRNSDALWHLDQDTLLAALEDGRNLEAI